MGDLYTAYLYVIISVVGTLVSHYMIKDLDQKHRFMEVVGITLKYLLIVAVALYIGWLIAAKILNFK